MKYTPPLKEYLQVKRIASTKIRQSLGKNRKQKKQKLMLHKSAVDVEYNDCIAAQR